MTIKHTHDYQEFVVICADVEFLPTSESCDIEPVVNIRIHPSDDVTTITTVSYLSIYPLKNRLLGIIPEAGDRLIYALVPKPKDLVSWNTAYFKFISINSDSDSDLQFQYVLVRIESELGTVKASRNISHRTSKLSQTNK